MAARPSRVGLVVIGLTLPMALTAVDERRAVAAEPECRTTSYDFDRDGTVDVAVGMPGAENAAGAVEVLLSNGGSRRVVRLEALDGRAGDRFGSAIAEVASFRVAGEEEQCSQLAVGAPGRDVAGKGDAGAVFVYRYDTAQQQFTLVREFSQGTNGVPGTAQAGARFGAALAGPYHLPDHAEVVTRLYAGAPGTDVGGAVDAGAFVTFQLADDAAVNAVRVTQGGGAPGAAERGDAFGSALAAARGDALVGAPGENRGAGGFVHWHVTNRLESSPTYRAFGPAKGLLQSRVGNPRLSNGGSTDLFVTQNTPGVPGTSEPGDHYGTSIYYSRESLDEDEDVNMVLVGAPDEDIGSARNAGSAHEFRFRNTVELFGVEGYNQSTPGVAGTPETGDRFGTALGTVGNFTPLVGVPGEDVGAVRNAGIVSLVQADRSWSQNSERMPGVVEAGDRFGATIANELIPFPADPGRGWGDLLLIGTPGENAGAGAVTRGISGAGSAFPTAWAAQHPQPGDGYGSAIGKTD